MFSHKLCSLSLQQGRVLTTLGPDHGGDEGADDYGVCGVFLSNLKKILSFYKMTTSGWKSPSNCNLTEEALSPNNSCALNIIT